MSLSKTIQTIALVFLCLAVSACSGAGANQYGPRVAVNNAAIDQLPGDRLIVPGQRVGPIYLGESIEKAIAILGAPDDTGSLTVLAGTPAQTVYQKRIWGRYGLVLYYAESDIYAHIRAIDVFSPKWMLASGANSAMSFGQAVQDLLVPQAARDGFCTLATVQAPEQCFMVTSDGLLLRSANRDSTPSYFMVIDAGLAARDGGGF